MKRSVASLLVILMTIVSVVSMMMPSAEAQTTTHIFTAQLLAANEVPPVAVNPAEANASGGATITLEVTRTGGVITSAVSRFDYSISGLASNIILSHIHQGGSTVNGPIVVDSNISPAAPVPITNGAASFSRGGLATPPSIAQAILDNPAGFYFNVHTVLSPQGVARGQLVPQQTGGGPVLGAPTLSEWGAILMTLLFIAVCTFFILGRGKVASALAAAGATVPAGPARVVDWRLLAKVTLYVEAVIAIALVAVSAGVVDVLGALTSGLVIAFTLHLFIGSVRRR
jgi:hypothetical protein